MQRHLLHEPGGSGFVFAAEEIAEDDQKQGEDGQKAHCSGRGYEGRVHGDVSFSRIFPLTIPRFNTYDGYSLVKVLPFEL